MGWMGWKTLRTRINPSIPSQNQAPTPTYTLTGIYVGYGSGATAKKETNTLSIPSIPSILYMKDYPMYNFPQPPIHPVDQVDGNIWKTIPDMAKLVDVSVSEFSRVMSDFDLHKTAGSYNRKFPTLFAINHGFVISVDTNSDYGYLTRWNYPKIISLFNRYAGE